MSAMYVFVLAANAVGSCIRRGLLVVYQLYMASQGQGNKVNNIARSRFFYVYMATQMQCDCEKHLRANQLKFNTMKKKTDNKRFNGLRDDILMRLTNFMFIYETDISKGPVTEKQLKMSYPNIVNFFKKNIGKEIKVKDKNKAAKYYITKKNGECKVSSFCRHLRNSFSHGLLKQENNRIHVLDKASGGNITANGSIEYKTLTDFLDVVIAEYDEKMSVKRG